MFQPSPVASSTSTNTKNLVSKNHSGIDISLEGGGSTSSLLPPLLNSSNQHPAGKVAQPPRVPRINLNQNESHHQVSQANQPFGEQRSS